MKLTKRQREVLAEIAEIPKCPMLLAVFAGRSYGIMWRLKQKGLVEVTTGNKMVVITSAGRKALEEQQ